MCTTSVIAIAGGFRLVTNRDEQRSRPTAEPPRWQQSRGVRYLAPTDQKGGGTWVAVGEHGLALCLLNLNPSRFGAWERGPAPPEPERSRGLIIPALIAHDSLEGVAGALGSMDLRAFRPFRLLASARSGGVMVVAWNAARADRAAFEPPARPPICLASSGLGDEVALPRLPLFERLVARDGTPRAQDDFHRHRWPDRPEASVLMSRPDARTVSITTVEVASEATMTYESIAER